MQINVAQVKVTTFDKGFMSIGPSIQNVVRGRIHANQGFGQQKGDFNYAQASSHSINDQDVFDFPIQRIQINLAGKRR